jgi:hypothetical protein
MRRQGLFLQRVFTRLHISCTTQGRRHFPSSYATRFAKAERLFLAADVLCGLHVARGQPGNCSFRALWQRSNALQPGQGANHSPAECIHAL